MGFHRAISIVTLTAFLPLALGCSRDPAQVVRNDVEGSEPGGAGSWPGDEGPVSIVGYTDRAGLYVEWDGKVRAIVPDSLEFTREVVDETWPYPDSSYRRTGEVESRVLHRDDVGSLWLAEPGEIRIRWGLVFVLAATALLIYAAISVAVWQAEWEDSW